MSEGFVYVAGSGRTGDPVKIGWSSSPAERLKQLQTGSPILCSAGVDVSKSSVGRVLRNAGDSQFRMVFHVVEVLLNSLPDKESIPVRDAVLRLTSAISSDQRNPESLEKIRETMNNLTTSRTEK